MGNRRGTMGASRYLAALLGQLFYTAVMAHPVPLRPNATAARTGDEPLVGELKMFFSDSCPPGWEEAAVTQGYLLVGRPSGGQSGTQINTPLSNGEKGRVGPHGHDVNDAGHQHGVNDPGHIHPFSAGYYGDGHVPVVGDANHAPYPTQSATTGISINSASSGITIKATTDEHYPLSYVLICQRVASVQPTMPSTMTTQTPDRVDTAMTAVLSRLDQMQQAMNKQQEAHQTALKQHKADTAAQIQHVHKETQEMVAASVAQVKAAHTRIAQLEAALMRQEKASSQHDITASPTLKEAPTSPIVSSTNTSSVMSRIVGDDPLVGELKLFFSPKCPPGWEEYSSTQGYLLVGRPSGGQSGTQINTPLSNGEKGRVGPHGHDVNDPGHSHGVTDPGHSHSYKWLSQQQAYGGMNYVGSSPGEDTTQSATTGISVNSASSAISIKATTDDYYPLAYVLVCQRVA